MGLALYVFSGASYLYLSLRVSEILMALRVANWIGNLIPLLCLCVCVSCNFVTSVSKMESQSVIRNTRNAHLVALRSRHTRILYVTKKKKRRKKCEKLGLTTFRANCMCETITITDNPTLRSHPPSLLWSRSLPLSRSLSLSISPLVCVLFLYLFLSIFWICIRKWYVTFLKAGWCLD